MQLGRPRRAVLVRLRAALPDEDKPKLVSVGRYALRGVRRAQELFTLDPEAGGAA